MERDGIVRLDIQPYPKQAEFFKARERFVAYGGARGGGKSWAARTKAQLLALRYPGIQILLLRRTMPELKENHVLPMLKETKGVATYSGQDRVFLFPNGSRIKLGYCALEGDVLQYQGQAYDVIFMEEATHFSEFQFMTLMESNRSSGHMGERFRPRMYFTCNPGGVGHAWVKRLFVDREYRGKEDPKNYRFIPSRVYDNYYLMENNPEYVEDLESLPEDRRRAMLDGDWDVFEGQYFPEFNRDAHVCKPFAIPDYWRVYRVFDYGLDMLACLWVAVDERERCFVIRELNEPNLPISEAARRMLEDTGERVEVTLAPPDLWSRSQESGRSKAEMFGTAGLPLVRTANDREAGWLAVKELLARGRDGLPQLRIFGTCTMLIKHLPLLRHDTHRPTDVAKEPHDITHGPDALRYFASFRVMPAQVPEVTDPYDEPDEVESFINFGR